MDTDLYFAFVLATVVLILLPGPTVSLVVANSIAYGARRALLTVAGSSSAMVIQLAVLCLGITSLFLVLSQWFEWLRWAGVAYLLYLGLRHWRAKPLAAAMRAKRGLSGHKLYWQGFLVTATNPKTLFFYAAFFPQFIDPTQPPEWQLVVLSVTFLAIATVLDSSYAVVSGRIGSLLRGERLARVRNRVTGSLLIGAGLGLALARRG